jgi:diacylglycerol kinase (ATP)
MKTSDIHIVVNPTAGSGKAGKIASETEQKVKAIFGSGVIMTFTKEKNDATFITRDAIMKGSSLIIAIGGDGTLNEVANGFFIDGVPINPDCELGIINCGTGRGFANSLKLPKTIDQQITLIQKSGNTTVDLGSITYKDFSGKVTHRLFINECQAGIGSEVASKVYGKKQKKFGGTLAFGITAIIQALKFNPISSNIGFDNEPEQLFKLIGLVIGNGTECAGGMKLTPGAKLDDAFFDVLLMHDMNISTRLLNLSKTYSGSHIHSPYFTIKKCKKLKVTSASNCLIEADGEMLGFSPFTIEILPAALKVKS